MAASALLWSASLAVRAASLNLCTDEYLLLLAEPQQIVAVTHLAHEQAETPLWKQARRHPRNDGSLLSVAPMRPRLVLTMGGGVRDRSRIAQRLGLRILDLPYPQTISDIDRAIGMVGQALGREGRARKLRARLASLRRSRPARLTDALWLGGGGQSVGANSLAADWMALAGLRQRRIRGDRVTLEQLLVAPPRVLLRSDYRADQYSGAQRWLAHPLARRARGSTTLVADGRRWTCLGPPMIEEVLRLRRATR